MFNIYYTNYSGYIYCYLVYIQELYNNNDNKDDKLIFRKLDF